MFKKFKKAPVATLEPPVIQNPLRPAFAPTYGGLPAEAIVPGIAPTCSPFAPTMTPSPYSHGGYVHQPGSRYNTFGTYATAGVPYPTAREQMHYEKSRRDQLAFNNALTEAQSQKPDVPAPVAARPAYPAHIPTIAAGGVRTVYH
eukprot:TRINITY_DN72496_c0_g1_i1.p2 TRINITY_DN72496_c0_g1~~TRINITY_DN72496_c0_g1_i1.p2  ORF type:complete len:170 (-),score=6.37 TRINITY_DN72496_c0_g1_i1:189-623(-)